MRSTVVLNVVGLTRRLLGPHTPNLRRLATRGGLRPLDTITPAATCPVQATFLTGALPRDHGIVANGWYFRDLAEVWFWRQSNRLVKGEQVWDTGRRLDPGFTCANLFWWYNMYSGANVGVTPRPMYPADGRKIPDCYAEPPELRDDLTRRFGRFPLFQFWGPATGIASSRWIARSAQYVRATYRPTLTLVYLPHLDYGLQRLGPDAPALARDLAEVDALCGELVADAEREGAAVIVLSEYGIVPVSRPVHINRALRDAGLIRVREELGHELLDAGASAAFAVADHQVAHVYVQAPDRLAEVKALLKVLPGVDRVLDAADKPAFGLDHPRSGELVVLAEPDAWFTYYYWLDDDRAPDFARTVDIHRKPGYDPVELFLNPALRWPKGAVGWRLLKKALGLRTLMNVIPLDATLVKGSHGLVMPDPDAGPLVISSEPDLLPEGAVTATAIKDLMLAHVFGQAYGMEKLRPRRYSR
ncbi:MAG TPA: nucleotide pyrophosphatase/phosphodiesterase family protein [Azospirillaceae bacterium]|nr:nucleotide pyrophosphatase/phosphodiesterase family protein [Azospirillaceae bacterium]